MFGCEQSGCCGRSPGAGTATAAQRERPKTTFFGLDPRVSHRRCDREVYDYDKDVRVAKFEE